MFFFFFQSQQHALTLSCMVPITNHILAVIFKFRLNAHQIKHTSTHKTRLSTLPTHADSETPSSRVGNSLETIIYVVLIAVVLIAVVLIVAVVIVWNKWGKQTLQKQQSQSLELEEIILFKPKVRLGVDNRGCSETQ